VSTKAQLRETTRQFCGGIGIADPGELAGDSPYNLVVAAAGRLSYSRARARWALNMFAGVPIPHLCQRTLQVRSGQLALHVMPHLIWEDITWAPAAQFDSDVDLALSYLQAAPPAQFAAPPTEADMSAVFIAAMSAATGPPGSTGLGLAVREACQQMSWRTVAAAAATLGESSRRPQDVVDALAALTSQPTQ